jgi:hypothetical protein
MSNKTNLEIRCLARLDELLATNDSIMEFLIAEELMTRGEQRAVSTVADKAKTLQSVLTALKGKKQIQLLAYQWELLPEERLKVLIITDRNQREFSYNY